MRCADNEGNGGTTYEVMTIKMKKKKMQMKMKKKMKMKMKTKKKMRMTMCSIRKYLLTSVSTLRGSMMTMIMTRRGMCVPAEVQDLEWDPPPSRDFFLISYS